MDSYQEFLLTVRRDVNCIADGDRNVRKGAVARLDRALFSGAKKAPPELAIRLFLEELHKPLLRLFADQTEKCRELSIAMVGQFVELLPVADLENVLPLMLAALLGRFRCLPFPEQSEELRLEALRLLKQVLDKCGARLDPFVSDLLDALSKALTDTCPDAKKECCEIIKKVSKHLDEERVSRAGGPLVTSLLANLRHQQWKVRRSTLESLGALLSLEAVMMDHMEEALPLLGALLGDRTPTVRQSLGECLERWLLKGLSFRAPMVGAYEDDGGPQGFDKFEHRLALLLLSVAADEDVDQVAPFALESLERVAARKHEARLQKAERLREQARLRREAAQKRGDEAGAVEIPIPDVEVAPDFDYSAERSLLPEPFASGRTPTVLTTTYVQLHLPTVLPQALSNLTQWTSDIRGSAARLLRVLLVVVNRQIAPFLDQVLVHLYKAAADDEPSVAREVLNCAGMVGSFLDASLVLGLVAKHLGLKLDSNGSATPRKGPGVEELWPENRVGRSVTRTVQDVEGAVRQFTATSVENRRQVFAVLTQLFRPAAAGAPARLRPAEVAKAVRFLEEGAQSDELLPWILGCTQSLLKAGGSGCCAEWPRLFDLLLRMRSGEECDASAVDTCMDELASLCGRPRRELYEDHLRARLGELLAGADAELWEERSPRRHVLETLLRNSGSAVAEHVGAIVPVLARQAHPEDAAVSARVDILGLVHYLLNDEDSDMTEALKTHAPAMLNGVLIPNCTWRAGQSNTKIRKGGMVCVHAMLRRHLVAPVALGEAFADLMPMLKSALDDSFSPDNRMVACLVLTCTLSDLQADINGEQLREVYPELLKRLDDSNDKIREAVCEALTVFFKCLPPSWSRSLFEYILRTLFVHLDDPNPEIQRGIYGALEAAVHQDYVTFAQEAKTAAAKSSHPRMCEELARLAESLRQSSDGVCME